MQPRTRRKGESSNRIGRGRTVALEQPKGRAGKAAAAGKEVQQPMRGRGGIQYIGGRKEAA